MVDQVMTNAAAQDDDHPSWAGMALAVVLVATLFRIFVVISSPFPLFFDEAQYWSWAQDLAFGYYSKPPVIAWVIAGTTAVCGDGEGCVRISAPLFHGATAMLLFFLGRCFYNRRTGFWAAATYALLPGVSLSAVIISTDVFLMFFWALALLALIQAEATNKWRWWGMFGVAIGFGLLSKYAMVFFFIGFLSDAVWRRSPNPMWSRPRFWMAMTLGGTLYLPNFLWNWLNGFPSYLHTGENINIGDDLFNPLKALEFFGGQFGVFGPILFTVYVVLSIAILIGKADGAANDRQRQLLAYSLPILVVITAEAFLTRAHANWAATAYVAATVFVVGELLRQNRAHWLKASLALHVVAAVALYNFDLIVRTFNLPITPGLDPARRMRGWNYAGDWIEELQRELPGVRLLFDDRKVMSELLYYVQPHPFDAVMWNPADRRNNHYEMTTDLSGAVGQDFLYVIRHNAADRAAPSFASSQLIATFRSRAYTGDALELSAYRLDDFKGYLE
jgi:4-amino-4-deoxy-L-arabinose transferase-like glycosyltransferase